MQVVTTVDRAAVPAVHLPATGTWAVTVRGTGDEGSHALLQAGSIETRTDLTQATLRADGSIASWGYNFYDQVTNNPPGTGFVQVAGGAHHSLTLADTADCNGNGIPDNQDILNGTSSDCDGNNIPDECRIADDLTTDWNGDGILNERTPPNDCTANPNSTGLPAVMSVSGSPIITDNNFTLTASQMPTFEYGYFLMAETQGFIPNVGGSGGNLCLGFPSYRFNNTKNGTGSILSSGPTGTFNFAPNLTNLPQGVVFMIGETWDFQAWYRDGAASTSNFTDGIEVMFR